MLFVYSKETNETGKSSLPEWPKCVEIPPSRLPRISRLAWIMAYSTHEIPSLPLPSAQDRIDVCKSAHKIGVRCVISRYMLGAGRSRNEC